MEHSKEEIESRLHSLLHEALENEAQEDGLINFEYDEESGKCYATLNVCIMEEDDFVGFVGY